MRKVSLGFRRQFKPCYVMRFFWDVVNEASDKDGIVGGEEVGDEVFYWGLINGLA